MIYYTQFSKSLGTTAISHVVDMNNILIITFLYIQTCSVIINYDFCPRFNYSMTMHNYFFVHKQTKRKTNFTGIRVATHLGRKN